MSYAYDGKMRFDECNPYRNSDMLSLRLAQKKGLRGLELLDSINSYRTVIVLHSTIDHSITTREKRICGNYNSVLYFASKLFFFAPSKVNFQPLKAKR